MALRYIYSKTFPGIYNIFVFKVIGIIITGRFDYYLLLWCVCTMDKLLLFSCYLRVIIISSIAGRASRIHTSNLVRFGLNRVIYNLLYRDYNNIIIVVGRDFPSPPPAAPPPCDTRRTTAELRTYNITTLTTRNREQ